MAFEYTLKASVGPSYTGLNIKVVLIDAEDGSTVSWDDDDTFKIFAGGSQSDDAEQTEFGAVGDYGLWSDQWPDIPASGYIAKVLNAADDAYLASAAFNNEDMLSTITAAAPTSGSLYVTVAQIKDHLDMEISTHDTQLERWASSVSRWVEKRTGRVFYAVTAQTRDIPVHIDGTVKLVDLTSLTSLAYDINNDRTYSETWTENTHFEKLPHTDYHGLPAVRWQEIAALPNGGKSFTKGYMTRLVGNWGYVENGGVPTDLTSGILLLASKWYKRREAVFNLMSMPAIGFHRIFDQDPDAKHMVEPFVRLKKRKVIG